MKPTQFAIGMLEVEYKVLELNKLPKKRLRKLLAATKIPVVLSPWNELCVIDHHHFLFACWHANIREVKVTVVKDYTRSQLSYARFWQKLAREGYAYLYDQFGEGPKRALYLPMDVRGMADDPYRSLAWMVRKEGGWENSDTGFSEFEWANFFRERGLLDSQGRAGFHKALKQSLRLARSHAARHLPGFIDPKMRNPDTEEKALKLSKYVPSHQKRGDLASVPQIG